MTSEAGPLPDVASSGHPFRPEVLLELINGVVWEADPVTLRNTYVSGKVTSLFGYSQEDWCTPFFWDGCVDERDRERIEEETRRGLASGEPYHLTYRLRTGDGRTRWVRDMVTPMYEGGKLQALGGVMMDFTAERSAQEALDSLQDRFSKVFEASPVGICISTLSDGRLLETNAAFEALSGCKKADLIGHSLIELGVWDGLSEREGLIRELSGGQALQGKELRMRRPSGEVIDVSASFERIDLDGEACLLAITQDIGARKQAEDRVRVVEARSRSLVQNSADVFSILDEEGRYTYISPSVQTVFGVEPEAIIGRSMVEHIHRDDVSGVLSDFQEVVGKVRGVRTSTFRMITANRSWRWFETTTTNMLTDPHIRGIVCSSRDVTDRKEAEQALARSEGRFRSLVQNASDIITVIDVDGVIQYESPAVERLLGYPVGGRVGQRTLEYIPQEEHQEIRATIVGLIRAGLGATARPVFRYRDADGGVHCLEALATNLLDDPNVGGIVVNSRDITERLQAEKALKASQDRLRSSEKLASLGRLTAGLAHEINTPLAATMNYLQLAGNLAREYQTSIGQGQVTDDDHREIAAELIGMLDEANGTTARIGEFIRQMRGHTRDTVTGVKAFDPARLAADTLSMVAHEARAAMVELHLESHRGSLRIRGEPGRFTQVLTNLVINAIHACEGVQNRQGRVDVRFVSRTEGVCLEVEDNGAGIMPEVMPRIFDPLFTTKEVGKGTGLGLAIIHDIVQGHFGGEITVRTRVGAGTVFSVAFPVPELSSQ
ncbi:PAS domain S-box protein (plasmid) [Deinococcus radiomollis]|uniref:PAS domain-containing sensor histidine kinase n=1 Tax=Deinococcus radiomollis TaxID=468916 RepID=UPI003891BE80